MGSKLPGPREPGPFHLRAGGRDRHKVILALCLANFLDCLDPGPAVAPLAERGQYQIGTVTCTGFLEPIREEVFPSGTDVKLPSWICFESSPPAPEPSLDFAPDSW